jgi:cobalt-zinc-cadmium efflux system membrane fusion protein
VVVAGVAIAALLPARAETTGAKVPADPHDHSAEAAKPGATESTHAGHAHENESPAPAEKKLDAHGHAVEEGAHAGEGEAHSDEVTLPAEAIKEAGIKTRQVRKEALANELTVPGRVSYNREQMAHIGTPVAGRIAEIKVKLGDSVKKGDALLVIDSPALGEAQSEYLQKHTQAQVSQSGVEVAQTAFERAQRLVESKAMALGDFQKRQGELKAAKGTLQAAQAAQTAAENTLHLLGMDQAAMDRLVQTSEISPKYTVFAPLGGCVIEREATLGEVVGPDRDALMVLADMTTLWVLADVPEARAHEIAVDATATVTVKAGGERSYGGRVAYIAPALDKATRTAQVRIEVQDGHTGLRPGMFAEVKLNCAATTSGLTLAIPESAVLTVEGAPSVFAVVPDEPNTYARKAVEAGSAVGGMLPVFSGLEEGALVVTDGAFILKAELAKNEMEGKTCSGH